MPRSNGHHYVTVQTRMWGGESFSHLSPMACSGQALWLFLLTCPDRHDSGVWRMGLGRIADLTGWGMAEVAAAMDEILSEGIASWDSRAQIILLTNSLRDAIIHSPNVASSWAKHFASLPQGPLVLQRIQEVTSLLQSLPKAYQEAFVRGFPKGFLQAYVNPYSLFPTPYSQAPRKEPSSTAVQDRPSEPPPTERRGGHLPKPEDIPKDKGKDIPKPSKPKPTPSRDEALLREYLGSWFVVEGQGFSRVQEDAIVRTGIPIEEARRIGAQWDKEMRAGTVQSPLGYAYHLLATWKPPKLAGGFKSIGDIGGLECSGE